MSYIVQNIIHSAVKLVITAITSMMQMLYKPLTALQCNRRGIEGLELSTAKALTNLGNRKQRDYCA